MWDPEVDAPDTAVADGLAMWEALEKGTDVLLPVNRRADEHKAVSTLLGQIAAADLRDTLFDACVAAAKKVQPELQREQDARAGVALRAFAEQACNAYAEIIKEAL